MSHLRILKCLPSLASCFMLSLIMLTAPASHAITGGVTVLALNVQVQFYVNNEYQCTGTLISTGWVMTARHCVTDTGATIINSSVYLGDLRLGQGERHLIIKLDLHPVDDVALLRLATPG